MYKKQNIPYIYLNLLSAKHLQYFCVNFAIYYTLQECTKHKQMCNYINTTMSEYIFNPINSYILGGF